MSKWKISEELSDENHIVIDTGERQGCILIERHIDGKDLEDIPNAQLIAAAPELYEALEKVRNRLKEYASLTEFEITSVLRALEKAEGKS